MTLDPVGAIKCCNLQSNRPRLSKADDKEGDKLEDKIFQAVNFALMIVAIILLANLIYTDIRNLLPCVAVMCVIVGVLGVMDDGG